MLLGLTEPTAGTARVLGLDPLRNPLEVKRRAGYLPDSVGFYDEMTARENLLYTARLNGISVPEANRRITEGLDRLGLGKVSERPVGTYSHGMRQRLGLAELLMKRAEVAILDEPTTGLDPEAALEFLQMIRGLKAEGITVLLSSHLLHQVQAVCDRVGLFDRGRMALEGTVDALSLSVLGGTYRIHVEVRGDGVKGDGLEQSLRRIAGVTQVVQERPGSYRLEAQQDCRSEVAREVVGKGAQLVALALYRPTLNDVYARYFQEARHEA
jgi:ABC-2 type transport system ATP-binding protein